VRCVCAVIIVSALTVLAVPLDSTEGIHRKWRTTAQEAEARVLEGAIREKIHASQKTLEPPSSDSKPESPAWKSILEKGETLASVGASYVKDLWKEAKDSEIADFLLKAYQGVPTLAESKISKNIPSPKTMDLEQFAAVPDEDLRVPVKSVKSHAVRSKKIRVTDLEGKNATVIDSNIPTFLTYPCVDEKGEQRCQDTCYKKIVEDILEAPWTSDSATANWVMCSFLNAGSGEKCANDFPETSVTTGYEKGRIQSNEGVEDSCIASMEQWIDILQDNCPHRPIVSKISMAIANSVFEFVVETRMDCKSRIYMASPSGLYGVRTWLRAPDQKLSPLDIYPFSQRIVSSARSGVYNTLATEIAKGKEGFNAISKKTLESIKAARFKYGSGKPLSKDEFVTYINTLRDQYVTYCDSLHNINRNIWQTLTRGSECLADGTRQKPRAQHFFTDLFGESLDKCSPSVCSFSFDVFAYDEKACQADLHRNRMLRAARNLQNVPDRSPKIALNWNNDEESPYAEDSDPTDLKFQEADIALPLQHWVMSSIYMAKRAMEHMANRFAAGNTQPKKFDINSFEDMQFQKQDILGRKWQADAVRRIYNGEPKAVEKSTKDVGTDIPETVLLEPTVGAVTKKVVATAAKSANIPISGDIVVGNDAVGSVSNDLDSDGEHLAENETFPPHPKYDKDSELLDDSFSIPTKKVV